VIPAGFGHGDPGDGVAHRLAGAGGEQVGRTHQQAELGVNRPPADVIETLGFEIERGGVGGERGEQGGECRGEEPESFHGRK